MAVIELVMEPVSPKQAVVSEAEGVAEHAATDEQSAAEDTAAKTLQKKPIRLKRTTNKPSLRNIQAPALCAGLNVLGTIRIYERRHVTSDSH